MINPTKVIENPDLKKARSRIRQEVTIVRDEIAVPERLLRIAEGKFFYIRTYGCQANVRDEENIKGLLTLAGFKETNEEATADLILINTCAIRENAEDKVFGELGILKGLKQQKPSLMIGVCGCMVQQTHIVDTITAKYRHVDLMFGTHNIHHLLELLDEVYEKKIRIVDVPSKYGAIIESMPSSRNHRFKAFVNIMYGCDKFCTYCIVPYTRGKERSRLAEDVVAECEELVRDGYQEITLVGQNVNAYGKDLPNGMRFAALLEAVAATGIRRLRFMTSHPWDFTDEMIDVIAKHPNIMKHIHLPFQSGSDDILFKMGRRYTAEAYRTLVQKMKEKIPGLSLTTDIIVGFPNETEEQFQATLDMVKHVGYDSCYTFIYSPRVGTPAFKMLDDIPLDVKRVRLTRLIDVANEEAKVKADRFVGGVFPVLVDAVSKKNEAMMSGYTESNKLVHFKGDASLIGQIIQVKINESNTYTMFGERVHG